MIVVGGSTYNVAGFEQVNAEASSGGIYWSNADPWPQGFGVFDLAKMVWTDSFDPSAGPYTTPKVVTEYYLNNPRYPDSLLQDPTLRDWFKVSQSSDNTTTTSHPGPGSSVSHHSNTGAIAGGVVGGVSGVVLVAVIVWLVLRHQKRRRRSQGICKPAKEGGLRKAELDASKEEYVQGSVAEMLDVSGQKSRIMYGEADGRPIHEMESGRPELST
jgi:hypothetical protein